MKRAFRVFLAMLLMPASLWAHHSYSMFDQSRTLSVHGTVTTLEWTNPHIWLWVKVNDDKGGAAVYGFESNAPSELTRFFGWSKRSVQSGDAVTIDYAPLKSGKNGGALRTVTFADGRKLKTPRSNPGGAR
jgi:hypothetical protein